VRILVIMLYWYPYEGPLMPIYGTVFKELIKKGHKITIVTSFPHYRQGRPETWAEYRGKLWEGATVIRSYVFAPVFKNGRASLVFRALNFLSFNITCLIGGLFFAGRQDLIFAPSSPPLTNGICGYIIGIFKRIPFIYNVQDIYPDMAIKLRVLHNKFIIRILRLIENLVYKKARKVLVLSGAMRRNLIEKKVNTDKIQIIPNFIDTNFIKPIEKGNHFSSNWALNDKFVVMYAGNIGLPHGVEFVVESAELLREYKTIMFSFVSRGEYKDKIMRLCEDKGLNNVVFPPQQPEHMVPQIWASADISLVTSLKGLSTDSVPSKTFAIMASGRPVIAMVDEGSEVWNMVEEANCGICVLPENPELLAMAILKLYENEEKRLYMGRNGRRYVDAHFSPKEICLKYEALFHNIIETGSL